MSTEYINIEISIFKKLHDKNITEYDRKVFYTLCANATFKHKVFGIYSRQTYSTLVNAVEALTNDRKQIAHLQRSVRRLEDAGLVKVLFESRDVEHFNKSKGNQDHKELIISLDTTATLQSICSAIENNVEDFNIYAERIKELEKNIGIKLNIVNKTKSIKTRLKSTSAELEEDSKLAAEFFPAQIHSFPEDTLISSAIASARDSPT
ncbi:MULTISPECIES: hypothetical protein [Delftia]|uniref:hypothetical protein n=1 Tax=Delftia TaxID=80865 RepID=UPI00257B508D|nr:MULTISPECIES: hypothetical protein [Delftia]MPT55027.1 hypothetical protein [Delftia sp.]